MKKDPSHRTNIIGAGEVGYAISIDMDKNNIHKMNNSFWDTKGNEVIGTTALPLYGAFVSEEKCHLFGDVSGKKLLEICCGTGHSLKYHGDRKAAELESTFCRIAAYLKIGEALEFLRSKAFNM